MRRTTPALGVLAGAIATALLGVIAFGAGASVRVQRADRDPVREDVRVAGHCTGTAGDDGTLDMQVDLTTFRATGKAFQFTVTESITVGEDLVHSRDERAPEPGRVHRAERHGHGRLVRGRAGPPAKQPCERWRGHVVVDRRTPAHAGECVRRIREPGGAGLDPGPSPGVAGR